MKTDKSTNDSFDFSFLTPKTILIFAFLMCFTSFVWGQSQYSYYILERSGHSLEPASKTSNSNGTLSLTFSSSSLNSFFQTKTVYKYEKAFPSTSMGNYLYRVYEVTVSNQNLVPDLSNLTEVELAEEVPIEYPAYTPNDPQYGTQNNLTTQLGLVRAPKAWDISHGNPTVIVGIADDNFDINHEDLANQIIYHVENSNNPQHHGTKVAGMVGAETDNGKGIAAVGFNVKLYTKEIIGANSLLALAQEPGVRVINYSYGGCTYSSFQAELYRQIRQDHDVLLLACAGNGLTWGCVNSSEQYVYPASYDHVVSVSSVGHLNYIGVGSSNWKDVHERVPGNPNSTHQHNDKVDLVAPGYNVRTTYPNSSYGTTSGTSFATPMVAGAAALVLSVKPDLTADQLENILKITADDIYWIPYNEPYIGKLGTGRLNVFRAVKTAECMDESNPTVELVVRDSDNDIGNEPNTQTSLFWKSEDIWVRNQDDGRYIETHQTVEYSPTDSNYVYVRITNYGCETSSGEDELKLYWSYAGTNKPWPFAWDGSFGSSTTPLSGLIGTEIIPALAPGQETVIRFEWNSPNPADYGGPISASGSFGLLARIISTEDPITFTNGSNITEYVKQNNNVAWKNINIVDIVSLSSNNSASFMITNHSENTQSYSLELIEDNPSSEKGIYEEAEVGIVMDSLLYGRWVNGGSLLSHMDSTNNPSLKRVNGINPKLTNITLQSGETGTIEFTFNFLTKQLIDKQSYEYNFIQRDYNNNEILGGATILINKENRNSVIAEAEAIENSNSTTLIAENIGEPAVYNWYDSEGNLIYNGTEFTVSPEITKTYKLEIISDLDGFKDYKEVEVSGNSPYSLGTLVPNPASSQVTVSYDVSSASSAYLIVTNTITAGSDSYILNTNTNQVTLNLSGYSNGIYTITLVCDGAVVDSKNLIKN